MTSFVSVDKELLVTVAGGKGTGDGSRVFVPPPSTDDQAQPVLDPPQLGSSSGLLTPTPSLGNNKAA